LQIKSSSLLHDIYWCIWNEGLQVLSQLFVNTNVKPKPWCFKLLNACINEIQPSSALTYYTMKTIKNCLRYLLEIPSMRDRPISVCLS
jgi:hypothetical protein